MPGMPLLTVGQVVGQIPDTGSVQVILRTTGQSTAYPIKMGYYGPADALRIRQRPLPSRGTWGLIAFPYGDVRNGIWLCAFLPSQVDAITATTSGSPATTDAFIDYESHFSGLWSLTDGVGQTAQQWPDGSWLTVSASGTLPTVYRHVVDAGNNRNKVPFPQSARQASTPPAYAATFHHATGTTLSINASGSTVVTSASGGTTVTVDSSGNVTFALGPGLLFNITQGGGAPTDGLALVSKLVTAFNAHTHIVSGVTTGLGLVSSNTPTSAWSASTVKSTAVDISN